MSVNHLKHSVEGIIHQSDALSKLIDKTNYIRQLTPKLQKALEQLHQPELANHCVVAFYDNKKLSIQTDSPAWEHQLRFIKPTLLTWLKGCFPTFKTLETIISFVEPKSVEKQETNLAPAHLSETSAKVLKETAERMPNARLKAALEALAERSSG